MATVIDSLIVQLGLDPKQFQAGANKVTETSNKTKKQLAADAKAIEDSGKQAAQFFSRIKSEALEFFSVVAGSTAIAQFTRDTIALNAGIGRLAPALNITGDQLSRIQGAVQQLGGTAGDATAALQALTTIKNNLDFDGSDPHANILVRLGINDKSKLKDSLTGLHNLADGLSKLPLDQAQALGGRLGIPSSVVFALHDGWDAFEKRMEKATGLTKEQIEEAQRAQTAIADFRQRMQEFGNTVLENVLPPLSQFLDTLGKLENGTLPGFEGQLATMSHDAKAFGDAWVTVGNDVKGVGDLLRVSFGWMLVFIQSLTNMATHMLGVMDRVLHLDFVGAAKQMWEVIKASPVAQALSGKSLSDYEKEGEAPPTSGNSGNKATGGPALRRNNPGNITDSRGQIKTFASTAEGYAAMANQIIRDFDKHGQNTIRKLIDDPRYGWANEWAPGNSKASANAYIGAASRALGIRPDDQFNPHDTVALIQLMAGMTGFEHGTNGKAYTADIQRGIQMAQSGGNSSTSTVHIGAVHIRTAATDADGIAKSIKPALENNALITQADTGMQ